MSAQLARGLTVPSVLLWASFAAAATPDHDPCDGDDPPAKGPRRHALLVGIGAYDAVVTDDPWRPLAGPTYDLEDMAALLRDRGFRVKCLFDAEATRKNILGAFERLLVKPIRPRSKDFAVFYFAGHGQQIPDDQHRDESDGLDEALVPYDHLGMSDHRQHIRDDEIGALARRVPHEQLLIILDTCHSGTANRSEVRTRGDGPRNPPVLEPPISDEMAPLSDYARDEVLLSAGAPHESVVELDTEGNGRITGAFTHALVEVLNTSYAPLTYRDLIDAVRSRISADPRADQTPTLYGDGRRRVFGRESLQRTPGFAARLEGDTWVVEAGRIHGLRRGSLLWWHHGARARPERPTDPQLILEEVGTTESRAVWLTSAGPRPKALGSGRAYLFEQPRPMLRVSTDVLAEPLAEALSGLPDIVVTPARVWDVAVRRHTTGDGVRYALESVSGEPIGLPIRRGQPMARFVASKDPDYVVKVLARGLAAHLARLRLTSIAGPTTEAQSALMEIEWSGARVDPDFGNCVGTGAPERAVGSCADIWVTPDKRGFGYLYVVEADGSISLQKEKHLSDGRQRLVRTTPDVPGTTLYALALSPIELRHPETLAHDAFAGLSKGEVSLAPVQLIVRELRVRSAP